MRTIYQFAALVIFAGNGLSQPTPELRGFILDPQGNAVPGATVRAYPADGGAANEAKTNREGAYFLTVAALGKYRVTASAVGFEEVEKTLDITGTVGLDLRFTKLLTNVEAIEVSERVVEPGIDLRNKEIFNRTLFTRDDQIFHTLGAGINMGQHSGGGKSLEVRRFGYNMDHGGVGGGLKIVIDNITQNMGSQGHGHGYLGSLKALSPELVEEVNLINGPFSALYGDFSGLGVVNIRTRDQMPDRYTARLQFGEFDTLRGFGAWSPQLKDSNALLAYEYSHTDGPYEKPLDYLRNNATAVWSKRVRPRDTLTLRGTGGINQYFAAGQLPVDEIEAGRLSPYGFIDPTEGGDQRMVTGALYWTHENNDGSLWRANGFVNRTLFDLWSNFTFFLNNEEDGDQFLQHDSRLAEGGSFLYQKPHNLFGGTAVATAGADYLDSQILIKLSDSVARVPTLLRTSANARVTNSSGYLQENFTFLQGKLQLGAGLRFDSFRFRVNDNLPTDESGTQWSNSWQPKFSLAYTPSRKVPFTFHANYGRGVTSANARAVVSNPDSPRVSTTDFYQLGTSHKWRRFSLSTSGFLIDRSNEQVWVADEGVTEFLGPSRSYGYEAKLGADLARFLTLYAGVTKVGNIFYKGTEPREYVDRAPHFTGFAGLTLSGWRGWSGSVRMRAINHYMLAGDEQNVTVPGHTVYDFSIARRINKWIELNFAVDNLLDKFYYETFERYTSRLFQQEAIERTHGTAGYPRTIAGGVTLRFGAKGD